MRPVEITKRMPGIDKPDRIIMLITAALVGIGILMIYSSTSVVTLAMIKKHVTTPDFYFKRHLITVVMGLVAAAIFYWIKPEFLGRISPLLLLGSLVMLGLVFTRLGISAGGARRWIRCWPSQFQPSEAVKLSMVLFLAWFLSKDFFQKESPWLVVVPVSVMGVFQFVFLKQPDFGGAATLGLITIGLLFIAGARLKYLAMLGTLALPVVYKLVREPYRWRRITAFLNPWANAEGSGFQLKQSLIALGRGGFFGVGLGKGMQKLSFLPEMHTDFIFAIIGEEMGFLIAGAIVIGFCTFFLRSVYIAEKTGTPFRRLLAYGIAMLVAVPGFINFCVVTGLAPTKGLPLPFISYGGSSLLVNMAAVGILLRVSRGGMVAVKQDRLMEIERRRAKHVVQLRHQQARGGGLR
ncbi:MAG: putative lipid II flippase FtsW [Actinomycetota bacterium]|nr:putative lipid II flippase FtsW [Actinomycetota bacterium]